MLLDDAYKEMFPNTRLTKDSKAAAQWATTEGGEYNAVGVGGGIAGKGGNLLLCVDQDTMVETKVGPRRAIDVVIGDELLSGAGWGRVSNKCLTTHEFEVTINHRLTCSKNHPIWVIGRGWVEASELQLGDKIATQTIWSKLWTRPAQTARSLLNSLKEKAGLQ
jgi:hypothetical protein